MFFLYLLVLSRNWRGVLNKTKNQQIFSFFLRWNHKNLEVVVPLKQWMNKFPTFVIMETIFMDEIFTTLKKKNSGDTFVLMAALMYMVCVKILLPSAWRRLEALRKFTIASLSFSPTPEHNSAPFCWVKYIFINSTRVYYSTVISITTLLDNAPAIIFELN